MLLEELVWSELEPSMAPPTTARRISDDLNPPDTTPDPNLLDMTIDPLTIRDTTRDTVRNLPTDDPNSLPTDDPNRPHPTQVPSSLAMDNPLMDTNNLLPQDFSEDSPDEKSSRLLIIGTERTKKTNHSSL